MVKEHNEVSFKTECRCELTCVIIETDRENLLFKTFGSSFSDEFSSQYEMWASLVQHRERLSVFFFNFLNFFLTFAEPCSLSLSLSLFLEGEVIRFVYLVIIF